MDFKEFPSIPRLSKDMIITEKLDGTNACVVIDAEWNVQAQSRNRFVTVWDDNHGFAGWVEENKEELKKLWEWYHYGEWWGSGVQRGYWLKKWEKRFSLFFYRWPWEIPSCVSMVPVLYKWPFSTEKVDQVMAELKEHGSYASPFMNPEGVVVFHEWSRTVWKKTFENDEGKWTAK